MMADEPGGGLDGGLEHHHAGEDGEAGEMVAEIFLGHRHIFGHDDALAGVVRQELIHENKFHYTTL